MSVRIQSLTCLALLAVALAGAAQAGERPPRPHDEPGCVEGEVLVRLKTRVHASPVAAWTSRNLAVKREFPALSASMGRSLYLLRGEGRTTAQLIAELAANPNVEYAEPNYLKYVCTYTSPNDTYYGQLWGLHNTGQTVDGAAGKADADIDYPEARALSRRSGNEAVVGVMDTGVDYTHPDLAPNMWVNPGEIAWNGVDDDHNGYVDDVFGYDFAGDKDGSGVVVTSSDPDPMDRDDSSGHGTHVSGTIAAVANNALGVCGVDAGARIMALKVSPDGNSIDTAAEIKAIDYAVAMKQRGVNIVALNASFGCTGSPLCFSSSERDAIAAAGRAGIVFCAAAGNDYQDNDRSTNTRYHNYPSDYTNANIVAVAATDGSDAKAGFSNYGAVSVDLGAPGVNIYSTLPVHLSTVASVVRPPSTSYGAVGMTFAGVTGGVTGVLYNCGSGNLAEFPSGIAGNIALIQRGALTFVQMAVNATAKGASAMVVCNNTSGDFTGTLQYPKRWLPAVGVTQTVGAVLKLLGNVTVTVVNRANVPYHFLDGTSMATPHVAGATAFMALNYPADSVPARRQRILSGVDALSSLSGLCVTGGRLNIAKPMDTDGDLLPDWWELAYKPALSAMNGTTDTDGDGYTDRTEYLAGTVPTDANSCPKFVAAGAVDADSARIQWLSASNRTYTIRYGATVTNINTVLAAGVPATPPVNTYTNTVSGVGQRFYRVTVEPYQ